MAGIHSRIRKCVRPREVLHRAGKQDDHANNIVFILDHCGNWRLAPAFDLIYACNPSGAWTSRRQMMLNGKRDGFLTTDLLAAATHADLRTPKAKAVIGEVRAAVGNRERFAEQTGVFAEQIPKIKAALRLNPNA